MKKPQQYTMALIVSVVIAVLVYMSLGVLGAMSYSMDPSSFLTPNSLLDGIDPLVILNIGAQSPTYIVCCICVCFVAYFSYPVAVFPGILALESGMKTCTLSNRR